MLMPASTRAALDQAEHFHAHIPRRREFLTFITWPFFLSEAFKSMQEFAGIVPANEEEIPAKAPVAEETATYPQPIDEESISRASPELPIIQSTNLAAAEPPLQVSHEPSSYSGNGLTLARSSAGPEMDGATASSGSGHGVPSASGADPSDDLSHQGDDPSHQGIGSDGDTSIGIGSQPIDLDISIDLPSPDVSLKLGPVSLDVDTGDVIGAGLTAATDLLGQVAGPVLETITDGVVSTLRELAAPVHDLLEGSVVPSGLLDLVDAALSAPSLGVPASPGTYTDYDVALRADAASGSSGSGILADIGGHQVEADIAWHASTAAADSTVTQVSLHSIADEVTLRVPLEIVL